MSAIASTVGQAFNNAASGAPGIPNRPLPDLSEYYPDNWTENVPPDLVAQARDLYAIGEIQPEGKRLKINLMMNNEPGTSAFVFSPAGAFYGLTQMRELALMEAVNQMLEREVFYGSKNGKRVEFKMTGFAPLQNDPGVADTLRAIYNKIPVQIWIDFPEETDDINEYINYAAMKRIFTENPWFGGMSTILRALEGRGGSVEKGLSISDSEMTRLLANVREDLRSEEQVDLRVEELMKSARYERLSASDKTRVEAELKQCVTEIFNQLAHDDSYKIWTDFRREPTTIAPPGSSGPVTFKEETLKTNLRSILTEALTAVRDSSGTVVFDANSVDGFKAIEQLTEVLYDKREYHQLNFNRSESEDRSYERLAYFMKWFDGRVRKVDDPTRPGRKILEFGPQSREAIMAKSYTNARNAKEAELFRARDLNEIEEFDQMKAFIVKARQGAENFNYIECLDFDTFCRTQTPGGELRHLLQCGDPELSHLRVLVEARRQALEEGRGVTDDDLKGKDFFARREITRKKRAEFKKLLNDRDIELPETRQSWRFRPIPAATVALFTRVGLGTLIGFGCYGMLIPFAPGLANLIYYGGVYLWGALGGIKAGVRAAQTASIKNIKDQVLRAQLQGRVWSSAAVVYRLLTKEIEEKGLARRVRVRDRAWEEKHRKLLEDEEKTRILKGAEMFDDRGNLLPPEKILERQNALLAKRSVAEKAERERILKALINHCKYTPFELVREDFKTTVNIKVKDASGAEREETRNVTINRFRGHMDAAVHHAAPARRGDIFNSTIADLWPSWIPKLGGRRDAERDIGKYAQNLNFNLDQVMYEAANYFKYFAGPDQERLDREAAARLKEVFGAEFLNILHISRARRNFGARWALRVADIIEIPGDLVGGVFRPGA